MVTMKTDAASLNAPQSLNETLPRGAQNTAQTSSAAKTSDRVELGSGKNSVAEPANQKGERVRNLIENFTMAADAANLVKSQVLGQPRVALQAQANQTPQAALRLLDITA
jgi:flagellin-like hook-associated protein FlgL